MVDKVMEGLISEDDIEETLKDFEKVFDVRIELDTNKVSVLLPLLSDEKLDSDIVSQSHILALSKLSQVIASQYGLSYKDFLSVLYSTAEASNNQVDLDKAKEYMGKKRQEFLNALDNDNLDFKNIIKK